MKKPESFEEFFAAIQDACMAHMETSCGGLDKDRLRKLWNAMTPDQLRAFYATREAKHANDKGVNMPDQEAAKASVFRAELYAAEMQIKNAHLESLNKELMERNILLLGTCMSVSDDKAEGRIKFSAEFNRSIFLRTPAAQMDNLFRSLGCAIVKALKKGIEPEILKG
jgi:hypothetical protein